MSLNKKIQEIFGVNLKQFFVGASYGSDFSELAKKVKASVPAITVGYNF